MHNLKTALTVIDHSSIEFLRDYGQDFPIILEALITAEDHRAKRHLGIDASSIMRALLRFVQGNKFGGVSTIEQQLARTIYPRLKRNLFLAKLDEIVLSFRISSCRPKTAIWSAYLMTAYYGTNLQGYARVRRKFCRTNRPVTRNQAAKIAACLKYPMPISPKNGWITTHNNRVAYVLSRWESL